MSNTTTARLGRLVLTALLALSWTNLPLFLAMPASATTARQARGDEPTEEAILALLRRLVATAEQELRAPGANPADIQAKAADLGYDVARTFAFVRDEIRYEPYRGVLRGARGALASGAGNALDKTLLLAALLENGGHQVRLMRGQLPPERAEALVRQFLEQGPSGPTAEELMGSKMELPPALAGQLGFAQSDLEAIVAESRAATLQFMDDATATTKVEADFLKAQIDAAGIKLGRSHEEWVAELSARATDHVWLEVIGTDGSATVLDPGIAGSQAGDPPAATGGAPVEDLKLTADRHTITFELVYGVKEGDGRVEKQLLEVPFFADESLYDPPVFNIQPVDPLPSMEAMLKMSSEELIKLFTGFKQYQAVVTVGHRHWASPAFDLKGNITPISSDGRVAGAQQLGGAVGRGFEDALGGGGDEPEANNFIDLSVMLTFKSPGAEPAKQQRMLLTQAQTTGEEFLSPILDWKMLIQPQALTPELVGYESLQNTIAVLGRALPILDSAKPAAARLEGMKGVRPSPFPAMLVGLAMLRQLAAATALAAQPSVTLLWDRPQMAIAEGRFCANATSGRTCGHQTIDLVDNGLSFIPRTADAALVGAAAEMNLRQGVFDTVAESVFLGGISGAVGLSGAIGDLSAARQAGAKLVAAAREDPSLKSTNLVEADRAWIAKYEPSNRRVVAPTTVPGAATQLSAWWSIDPETGNVVGRRDGGRGQAQAEYIAQVVVMGICMIVVIANLVLDRNAAVERGGGLSSGAIPGAGWALLGCVVGALGGIAGVAAGAKYAVFWTIANGAIAGAFSLYGASVARQP